MFKLLFFLLLLSCVSCTQNEAIRSARAQYPIDSTLVTIVELPSTINETSGLINIDGSIWTHNDSGDDPVLYNISNTTNKVKRKVWVSQANSDDWEDIAQDSFNIYIGNFGNNVGNRKDLEIYILTKEKLMYADTVEFDGVISFAYPAQSNFNLGAYQHNYDCEAMIAVGDSLYLFSKNHLDYHSSLYRLPKTPGDYNAVEISKFNTKGMITAATINPINGVVALLGYEVMPRSRKFEPFVWLLSNYRNKDFFDGNKKRLNLPLSIQAEGICFLNDLNFLISNEEQGKFNPSLHLFDAGKYIQIDD